MRDVTAFVMLSLHGAVVINIMLLLLESNFVAIVTCNVSLSFSFHYCHYYYSINHYYFIIVTLLLIHLVYCHYITYKYYHSHQMKIFTVQKMYLTGLHYILAMNTCIYDQSDTYLER